MSEEQPSKSAAALRSVLQKHKVSDVVAAIAKAGNVVEIESTASPTEAASVLWENNVLGAPVWDAKKGAYIGFFDMRDILSAVVAAKKETKGKGDSLSYITKPFSQMNVTTSYLAARNPFHSCTADTSLLEACRILTKYGCDRIPVVDSETGRCVSLISQSTLVKFLSANVHEDMTETLEVAHFPYKKDVVTVKDTTSATEVFGILDSHRLSGIAVVDEEDGRLVGNTSARDIKMAALDEGVTIDMDILSYLAAVRQATPVKKERYPSAHVHEDTCTVGHAVHMLAKTGYHRLFVVDNDVRPVGVISVTDVIEFAVGPE